MLYGVVSGDSRGMGVLDWGGDRRREGAVLGVNVTQQWDSLREGQQRDCSQITFGFRVIIISASLAIRIAERSSIVIEHSSSPSVRTCALLQNG